MKLGIIGLPNVGKSTLFNAITNAGAAAANYPFCTIEPNVGMVAVPDRRLDMLAEMYHPKKLTPAVIEFVDIAGLVRGASNGEGLGNKFLSHIREVDALVHVVRCFKSGDVVHVEGDVDPLRDIGIIETELILSDIEVVERRLDKTLKLAKGDKTAAAEAQVIERLLKHLQGGEPARLFECTDAERELTDTIPMLSAKPVIYAANLSDDVIFEGPQQDAYYRQVAELAERQGEAAVAICASAEAEIASLPPEDKKEFFSEMGVEQSGLEQLITQSYALLGLISFLTAGEPEVRAWTIAKGTKAPQAAGKIHSDFERGFIRAEVVPYEMLVECGSLAAAREKGLVRSEGKEYVMKDGDVVLFRFNV